MRQLGFFAAGVVLFALPFLSMGVGVGHHAEAEPHTDHERDHHLEVVEGAETIEVE